MNHFEGLQKRSNAHHLEILYEDNHIIAINKPPGLLSQGDRTGDEPLTEVVKEYIKVTYHKPGAVFLGLVHRLDRPTSGILLFARTSKALERLNALMKQRAIQKTYWAIVSQKPPAESGALRHFLTRMPHKNITRASLKQSANAREALLDYRVLKQSDGYFLLEIIPHTGRQHQIRVQLSAIGCPIVGDLKYGYPVPNPDKSICLHARRLQFVHPVSKKQIDIIAGMPQQGYWKQFV
jgi:23S rRNA pseudouridine1911/1915/1917 synthase